VHTLRGWTALNQERRGIEADMQEHALASLEHIDHNDNYSLAAV